MRLGYADSVAADNTIASLQRAIRLAPANARYHTALADLLDQAGEDPRPSLRDAARLNPYDASTWIQLGVRAELDGDVARAEQYLLRATASRQFRPRWALADFYFRQKRTEEFWTWSRAALATGYPSPFPLFRLAWLVSPDAGEIMRRAIPPDRPEITSLFLRYLLNLNRVADAAPVAEALAGRPDPGHEQILLEACERLLRIQRVDSALAIWNALAARGATPYAQLAPDQGASLTNGDMRVAPASIGFDWHLVPADGMAFDTSMAQTLAITFSGQQPDRLTPLTQWLPLEPARRYRFEFEFDASAVSPDSGVTSGLFWRLRDSANNDELLDRADISGSGWQHHAVEFSSGPETRLALLTLEYLRPPGTKPVTGTIALRNVKLEFAR